MTQNVPSLINTLPSENELQIFQTVAKNAANSGLYTGVGSEQKILMILLAARELGVAPMTALNGGLWNIQGKIEISARMINCMLRKAGIKITVKRSDAKGCILEGTRPDTGDTCIVQFLEEDAARAGVLNRGPWKQNPEDMYWARAISKLGRRLAPDVLGTAYAEGEIRDSVKDSRGEIIEAETSDLVKEKQADVEVEGEKRLVEFIKDYPEEDHELIRSYFEKYCSTWKDRTNLLQAVEAATSKRDKFDADFKNFKSKQVVVESKAVA